MSDGSGYRGLYINLDRSIERRRRMEAQLHALNLRERYARFTAVDGLTIARTGAIRAQEQACFQSHYLALKSVEPLCRTAHIIEDDAIFVPQIEQMICSLDERSRFDAFDIVFTLFGVPPNPRILRKYKQLFDGYQCGEAPSLHLLNINDDYHYCTGSYLVPARAAGKVLSAFRAALDAGPNMPIDLFIRHEAQQGRLQLGCIFPFITGIEPDLIRLASTIDRAEPHISTLEIVWLLTYSFFLGRDFNKISRSLMQRLHPDDTGDHQRLIGSVLSYIVCSSDFSDF